MKHLKRYNEDLRMLSEWDKLLSDEEFNQVADEFDSIIEPFFEYADEGYKISFETAYGRVVRMTYDDYTNKNEVYKEFIHGLPAHGLFFTSTIRMPYDYKVLLDLLQDVQSCVDRLKDIGWSMSKFEVKGITPGTNTSYEYGIAVSHEFKKGDRR